jgi:SAM-dependent methyltransferase
MRDTDADWRAIGATFPYWGVLTAPEYRQAELDPALLETFYATGRAVMADIAVRLEAITRSPLQVGSAIDFGCGVGRLTEAMTAYAGQAIGIDVSPGMLDQARANGAGVAVYDEVLPEGPVDWINSYIVFQHIPPERGLVLFEALLSRLAPGGLVSLHFTTTREAHLGPTPVPLRPSRTPVGRLYRRLRPAPPAPEGQMLMHDYDLGQVLAALHRAGIAETRLWPTNHGGHHGEMIFGRREI